MNKKNIISTSFKMLTFYHNPRCSKSRQTLKIAENSGEEINLINYLVTPPTEDELKDIVEKLGLPVEYIVRKNESIFKEKYKGKDISENEWYKILVENPILIERPIVMKGDKAVLGRPPENVEQLL